VQSGNLFRTIRKFSVREINKNNARFGTDAKVAKFHQYGTWSMPKREIIFEPPMFARKLAEYISDHVEDAN
jgi:phage gpG-like protein